MGDTVLVGGVNYSTDDITNLNGGAVTAGTNQTQRIKVQYGDDNFARDVSLAFPMPVILPDVVATGTISATDIVVAAPNGTGTLLTGTPTAGSFVPMALPGGDSAWVVQVTGTFGGGTVWFGCSANSTNGSDGQWSTLSLRTIGTNTTVIADGTTIAGLFRGTASGMAWVRVRMTGATTPSVAVVLRAADAPGPTALNAPLPAGTNIIGAANVNTAVLSGLTTMQSAAVAVGAGTPLAVTGYGTAVLQVSGTFVATTVFEASVDAGTTWSAISATQVGAGDIFPSTTIPGLFRITVTGIDLIRARVSSFTSGAVTVVGRATNAVNASKVVKLATSGNTIGTVRPPLAGTGTITAPASSATSVTVLAANAARLGATLTNDSTATLYLALSAAAASVTAYTIQVAAGGYYELPNDGAIYTGAMTGIWAAANGNARVTELTA